MGLRQKKNRQLRVKPILLLWSVELFFWNQMFVFGFRITFVCKSYFYNRPLNCLCQQKNVVLFTTKITGVEQ